MAEKNNQTNLSSTNDELPVIDKKDINISKQNSNPSISFLSKFKNKFKSKSKIDKSSVSNKNNKVDKSNIFDEFVGDTSLMDEVNKIKKENNRDIFYYIANVASVLQTIFWLWFIVWIILFLYIFIQNNDKLNNSNILDPFCPVFLSDIQKSWTFCSSISWLNNNYDTELSNLKTNQVQNILSILEKLYSVKNFTKTKDVIFLADKSDSKLKVLSILEEFDNLKNGFDPVEKEKIQCNYIQIDSSKQIISMNCAAFSAWFWKWIRWFDGTTNNTLKWTSLSLANSFLNYIDKNSEYFNILDRQKIFRSENIVWNKTNFTNKTAFVLKLKYNLK